MKNISSFSQHLNEHEVYDEYDENLDLSDRKILDRSFYASIMRATNFRGSDIRISSFYRANLTRSDFSAASIADCKFIKANITDCDFRSSNIDDTDFHDSYTESSGLPTSGLNFSGANIESCTFKSAKLNDVDFTGSEMQSAEFDHASLMGAKFHKSMISECIFYSADLRGAEGLGETQFYTKDVPSFYTCDFTYADFRGVDLSWFDPVTLHRYNKVARGGDYTIDPRKFFAGCIGIDDLLLKKWNNTYKSLMIRKNMF